MIGRREIRRTEVKAKRIKEEVVGAKAEMLNPAGVWNQTPAPTTTRRTKEGLNNGWGNSSKQNEDNSSDNDSLAGKVKKECVAENWQE